ncbi:MAG: DUF6531 domain-containing protein [Silvimonas sp.]|nr:DUF6531 domain-containing protein [Silvimonas sp.]
MCCDGVAHATTVNATIAFLGNASKPYNSCAQVSAFYSGLGLNASACTPDKGNNCVYTSYGVNAPTSSGGCSAASCPVGYTYRLTNDWIVCDSPQSPVCANGQFLGSVSNTCRPICSPGQYLSRDNSCKSLSLCTSSQTCAVPVDVSANAGQGCPTTGNPVTTATGNKYQEETDFSWLGMTQFHRFYNSESKLNAGLGAGWRHTYLRRVTPATQSSFGAPPAVDVDPDWNGYVVSGTSPTFYILERDDGKRLAYGLSGQPQENAGKEYQLTISAGSFIVVHANTTETYDSAGTLLRIDQPDSGPLFFTYDSNRKLSTVGDARGRQLAFLYSAGGMLVSIQANNKTVVNYGYDSGRLSFAKYPDNAIRSYSYEDSVSPYLLTGITDENGVRYASWTYNSAGQAVSTQHAGGVSFYRLSFGSVDAANGYTDVIDPLGSVRRYSFTSVAGQSLLTGISQPAGLGCSATVSGQTFDANGNVTSRTNFNGSKTTFVYDLNRNLETSRTEAASTAQARTITTNWHPTFSLPAQITETNQVTSFSYDTNGNLLSKSVAASGKSRSWNYTYNSFGQVLTATDPDSNKTSYTYDTSGNLTRLTDAKGHITQFTSYDANGNLLAMTDPNGKVTTLTWDARNRLKSRQSGSELTSYTYDLVGQLTSVVFPDGSSVSYTYDPAHRLTNITDSHGNSIAYTLDAAGNHLREDVSDPAGQLAAAQTQVTASQTLPNGVTQ